MIELLIATVAVVTEPGAVQAKAEQEQVMGSMVIAMVAVEPLLEPQSAKVVVIVKVSVT